MRVSICDLRRRFEEVLSLCFFCSRPRQSIDKSYSSHLAVAGFGERDASPEIRSSYLGIPLVWFCSGETMTPSSTGDSPGSTSGLTIATGPRTTFPLPSRDNFAIEIPTPIIGINGTNALKSPSGIKSQRASSFGRDGILGSAQKARNMSQSSDNRPDPNGLQKVSSDEGIGSINPLKRRNTGADAGVDYPRRRATIAV